jgi:hypothetical protein
MEFLVEILRSSERQNWRVSLRLRLISFSPQIKKSVFVRVFALANPFYPRSFPPQIKGLNKISTIQVKSYNLWQKTLKKSNNISYK